MTGCRRVAAGRGHKKPREPPLDVCRTGLVRHWVKFHFPYNLRLPPSQRLASVRSKPPPHADRMIPGLSGAGPVCQENIGRTCYRLATSRSRRTLGQQCL